MDHNPLLAVLIPCLLLDPATSPAKESTHVVPGNLLRPEVSQLGIDRIDFHR
jgi:hypothetical protein